MESRVLRWMSPHQFSRMCKCSLEQINRTRLQMPSETKQPSTTPFICKDRMKQSALLAHKFEKLFCLCFSFSSTALYRLARRVYKWTSWIMTEHHRIHYLGLWRFHSHCWKINIHVRMPMLFKDLTEVKLVQSNCLFSGFIHKYNTYFQDFTQKNNNLLCRRNIWVRH